MEPNSLLALRWLRSTYTQVWAVDTEYRQTPEGSPHVVCVVMREVFGRLPALHLFEHEFQKECPVDFSRSDVLFVSYAAPAEIGSFLQIGWPVPRNILDLFVEARMNANTIGDIKSIQRVKLLSTLAHYGLDSMDYVEKDEMRALILGKASYTPEERKRILEYCDKDVLAIIELLPFMLPEIPGLVDAIKTGDRKTGWVQALFRGRYQAAVTRIDREGVPIDVEMHDRLMTVRPQIRQRLIDETNLKYDVYTGDTFTLAKFTAFLNRQGIWWPQTRTGLPKTDEATFDSMRYTYPELNDLYHARKSIKELNASTLSIFADGCSRAYLNPFGSATSDERLQVKVATYLVNLTPERRQKLEEMPYSEFLRTTKWKHARWLILQFWKKCAYCDGRPTEVHHRQYDYGRLHLESLEGVCHTCDQELHGFVNETAPPLVNRRVRKSIG
jgi:DNA polymerase I